MKLYILIISIFCVLLTVTVHKCAGIENSLLTRIIQFRNLNMGNTQVEKSANLNSYVEEFFKALNSFSMKHGWDPKALPDFEEKFLGAQITLFNGTLHGISSINRTDDVEINYLMAKRKISIHFPIDFNNIYFLYCFEVKLLFVSIQGHIKGEVRDFETNATLSFDLNDYKSRIENIITKGMGPISLTFGEGIIANVANILSKYVTEVLHPILEAITRETIEIGAQIMVHFINREIHVLLNNTYNS